MLKIRDDVDLKELEKFGFEKLENGPRGHKYIYFRYDKYGRELYNLYINKDNYIRFRSPDSVIIAGSMQTLLYDLIKADLVEKVGDDNG